MRITLLFLTVCFTSSLHGQSQADETLLTLIDQFESHTQRFPPPSLELDFKVNLNNELSQDRLSEQKRFFSDLQKQLQQIETGLLSKELQLDQGILLYEAIINTERLHLIEKTTKEPSLQKLDKIYDHDKGADWYAWFLKKWTSTLMKPEEVMAFGHTEVERVKNEIAKLNLPNTKPAEFLTTDTEQIVKVLNRKKELIRKQLDELMPDYTSLPNLTIAQGINSRLAQTPGYYDGSTFYFNLFEQPFDLTDCDWLLIHEGNPGHHFQVNYHNDLSVKPYRSTLRYMGFVEGWAAYTENLGWDMGLYKSPWEALGKWNWDLIRSVRIVLDVGLNYYGWSDEKARVYWKQHIKDQDDIATREINRMKRWPAQVLTYKLGEAAILQLLQQKKEAQGESFNYKAFHSQVLSSGIVPVHLISFLLNPIP